MKKLRAAMEVSFGTKVLVPVVASMVLLMAITAWTVNERLTQQFQAEAARSMATAEAVLRNTQKIHTHNLLLRLRNLSNEPRYKAALQSGHLPTLRDEINNLPADQDVDIALFTLPNGDLLASAKRDPLVPISEFFKNSATALQQTLKGEENVDMIPVGERLFDVVSIPVFGTGGDLIGALTFGSEITDPMAQELGLMTHSQIVLLANQHVIASTIPGPEAREEFIRLAGGPSPSSSDSLGGLRKVLLGEEHYFCVMGHFKSLSGNENLGYLLLASYEQPLRSLRSTQEMLFLVSLLSMLLGTVIVWLLVRRVTRPLRDLRDSVEAVGRGDFSRRVGVKSRDECGELASAFNQMSENLRCSREELEQTLERLKSTQAQLVQSEKLSGLGEFVAGVAHELNNPLTSVMGFSELLARADAAPQHRRHLELIHKSALRCQRIVQNLLSFARRRPPERKLTNINGLVETTIEFLQYQLRTSNIEVVTHLAPGLPATMLDPHQVQQVLVNILNNARQAIEAHRGGGRVELTTELCGQTIRVIFQDNGPGISAENLPKLFDPFFTTKEVGKGTGLGLSLCYGIVKEHGGTIQVRSKPGEGATFIVELPLLKDDGLPLENSEAPAPKLSNEHEGAGKRVLVIDDEEAILEMVRAVLSEHGYLVDLAQDGEAALRSIGQTSYDLALCDWKMPGLSGQQIYERVRAANPALCERMIFMTGDVINEKAQKFLRDSRRVCLSKPFSLVEFRAAVEKALVQC